MSYSIDLTQCKNLSTVMAEQLAEMIRDGILRPRERLVQTGLAARFRVSRVAVRDALHLLREWGLAVDVPQKGIMVRPVSARMVSELFEVRAALEPPAISQACAAMSNEQQARLETLVTEQERLRTAGDIAGLIKKDGEFHWFLIESCPNVTLKEMITTIWSRMRQARSLARFDTTWGASWGRASVQRHRRLCAALRRHDHKEILEQVSRNIAEAREELLAGLGRSNYADDTGREQESV